MELVQLKLKCNSLVSVQYWSGIGPVTSADKRSPEVWWCPWAPSASAGYRLVLRTRTRVQGTGGRNRTLQRPDPAEIGPWRNWTLTGPYRDWTLQRPDPDRTKQRPVDPVGCSWTTTEFGQKWLSFVWNDSSDLHGTISIHRTPEPPEPLKPLEPLAETHSICSYLFIFAQQS